MGNREQRYYIFFKYANSVAQKTHFSEKNADALAYIKKKQ